MHDAAWGGGGRGGDTPFSVCNLVTGPYAGLPASDHNLPKRWWFFINTDAEGKKNLAMDVVKSGEGVMIVCAVKPD